MKVKVKLRYLRIAPRKVRLVADLIRGKKVVEAKNILDFSIQKSAKPLRKLLDSAQANAQHNFQLDPDTLQISEIKVDEGPKLKRWRARARGRASEIQKKTSHITLVLEGEKLRGLREEKKREERAGEMKEEEKVEEKIKPKIPKAKKPEKEIALPKQAERRGWRRIFRRKSF